MSKGSWGRALPNFPITTPVLSCHGRIQVYGFTPHAGAPGVTLSVLTAVRLDSAANFIRIKFGDIPLETTFGNDLEGVITKKPAGMTLMKMRVTVPPVANGKMQVPLTVEVLEGGDKALDQIQFGEFTYAGGSAASLSSKRRRPTEDDSPADNGVTPAPAQRRRHSATFSPNQPFAAPTSHPRSYSTVAPPMQYMQTRRASVDQRPVPVRAPFPPTSATFVTPAGTQHQHPSGRMQQQPQPARTAETLTWWSRKFIWECDPMVMCRLWSQEEVFSGRRLVQFWRRPMNLDVHIMCGAITQADYHPGSIVISCIYRQGTCDFLFTFFDFITLLEGLLQRTYVEPERHGIVAMIEDLALPLAVPDCAGLLDLVRDFDHPKAKGDGGTKLYPWGVLSSCLKRAMGDYSRATSWTSQNQAYWSDPRATPVPGGPNMPLNRGNGQPVGQHDGIPTDTSGMQQEFLDHIPSETVPGRAPRLPSHQLEASPLPSPQIHQPSPQRQTKLQLSTMIENAENERPSPARRRLSLMDMVLSPDAAQVERELNRGKGMASDGGENSGTGTPRRLGSDPISPKGSTSSDSVVVILSDGERESGGESPYEKGSRRERDDEGSKSG